MSTLVLCVFAPLHVREAEALPLLRHNLPVATCGRDDPVETGLQGEVPVADQLSGRSRQGYRCNMGLVGRNTINGEGMDLTAGMAWYGDCAYLMIRQNAAIAVVDAADPAHPQLAQILANPVGKSHEGMHASAARGILVVPRGDVVASTPETEKLAVFDVHDCRRPRLITVFDSGIVGSGIHAGQLSADGRTYFATFLSHGPCVTAFGLDDVTHPTVLASYGDTYPCHDLDVSRDGTRAYLGSYGTVAEGGAAVAPLPLADLGTSLNPRAGEGTEIVDTSEIQARKPGAQIRRVATLNNGRPHTQAVFRSHGRRFVLVDTEGGCANTSAKILDVTDERRPKVAADMTMEYHASARCMAEWVTQTPFSFTTHYVGFDSADDSSGVHEPVNPRLAFIASRGSGLRAVDISDPYRPKEVGYFSPPVPNDPAHAFDMAQTWVRYRPETGEIWYGNTVNGLTIVRMDPCQRGGPSGPRTCVARRAKPPLPATVAAPVTARAPAAVVWSCNLSYRLPNSDVQATTSGRLP